MGLFNKVFELANVAVDSMLVKARKSMAYRDQKAFDQDPYYPAQEQGWRERFTMVDFDMMYKMSRDSIVSCILQTRATQAKNFSRPQKTKYDVGYAVNLRDEAKEMGTAEQEEVAAIIEWIKYCGVVDETRTIEQCELFGDFLYKIVMDRYTYDQIAIEPIPTFDKKIHHLVNVDAATIRLASTRPRALRENLKANMSMAYPGKYFSGEKATGNKIINMSDEELAKLKYVQVYNGRILEGFQADELIVKFGNPTSRVQANGYSVGELEKLVTIITSHLHAENHNKLQFTHGQAQKGIIHIKGDVRPVMLEAFRRHWFQQATGNSNAWRTPIIASQEEVKWIPLNAANRDMEFTQWMNYLIKIICSLYQIDPEEINFGDARYKSGAGSSPVFMSANENRIKHSQDRGLRPLLRFVEELMNDHIFKKMGWSDKYVFEFVGLNAETLQEEIDRNIKEGQNYKTVDEIRKEHGMEPLGPEKGGHLIQNASFVQWVTQFGEKEREFNKENQEAMQGQDQGAFEEEGGEPGSEDMTLEELMAEEEGKEKPDKKDQDKKNDKKEKSIEEEDLDLKKGNVIIIEV